MGVRGPITGKGARCLIIDDPVKNDEEAFSKVRRESMWNWYRSTALTRLTKDGRVVLMQTRWHEDDLGGRILKHAKETGEEWEVISMPAISQEGSPDEYSLCEGLYPLEVLKRRKAEVGTYWWSAMYQQTPTPEEGGVFKRHWLRYYRRDGELCVLGERPVAVGGLMKFATLDFASSLRTLADKTVIAVWGITTGSDPQLILLDLYADRLEGPDIIHAARRMCVEKWEVDTMWPEPTGLGLPLVQEMRRKGFPIREMPKEWSSKDKVTRAMGATPYVEAGNMWLPADAEWLSDYEYELLSFPAGEHDDQVDVTAYAVNLLNHWTPGMAGDAIPDWAVLSSKVDEILYDDEEEAFEKRLQNRDDPWQDILPRG